MSHDDIIIKVQMLADRVQSLKEENKLLKEEQSRMALSLAEANSKILEPQGNPAEMLIMQQKEAMMRISMNELQASHDKAKAEIELLLQTLREKDARLHDADTGVSKLSSELSQAAGIIDEKDNIIYSLEQRIQNMDEYWLQQLREKDEAIARYTEELKIAVNKLESLQTERHDLTSQLDDLISEVDDRINELKNNTNG